VFFAIAALLGAVCLVILRNLKIGETLDVGPDPPTHRAVELVKVDSKKDLL
jgi:hypothetical protein